MDTHADTCVAGKNWAVLKYSDVVCEVQPFTDKHGSVKEVPIVTACTVWTDQNSGKEYLLVGEQFLWFGSSLEHSLINPNQLRANYLKVQDNPFEPDAGISGNTNDDDDVFIPFDTTGTIVSFESRVPTEFEMSNLPVIVITADQWDPGNVLVTIFVIVRNITLITPIICKFIWQWNIGQSIFFCTLWQLNTVITVIQPLNELFIKLLDCFFDIGVEKFVL